MPELPEVETIRRDLEKRILSKSITSLLIHDQRILHGCKPASFKAKCLGQIVAGVSRRGKAVIISFQSQTHLIVQLMMTGQLIYLDDHQQNKIDKHTKLTFLFHDNSCLNYNDQRLFGRLTLVNNLEELKFLKMIGPEPFQPEFNPAAMKATFKSRKAPIKSLLMNQNFVAGIGNIYASEILFDSRINPRRLSFTLKNSEIESLHRSTVKILKEAIQYRGTSMRNYLDSSGAKGEFINRIKVYGRENEACLICRTRVVKIVQSGRSTFYCKRCQK